MKIIFKGHVFNNTGFATVNREVCSRLSKIHEVQVLDPWNSNYPELKHLNNPVDTNKVELTLLSDYPITWRGGFGKRLGHWTHEGTRLDKEIVEALNSVPVLWVPTKATYNLLKWNGYLGEMHIIPYGVTELYKPIENENEEFIFLSVNSWTGKLGDRKGTDLLIKAFHEEFKTEKVKLILKVSTFWDYQDISYYVKKVLEITGEQNNNILINSDNMKEEDLVEVYQKSDCFVAPTRGEGFGMTILNAMATGLPVIVTNDRNSGHMDFCRGVDSVLWVDAPTSKPGDRTFYCEGNMLAEPDLDSLKKQMREAYDNRKLYKERALANSEIIRKEFSWDNTVNKLNEVINGIQSRNN